MPSTLCNFQLHYFHLARWLQWCHPVASWGYTKIWLSFYQLPDKSHRGQLGYISSLSVDKIRTFPLNGIPGNGHSHKNYSCLLTSLFSVSICTLYIIIIGYCNIWLTLHNRRSALVAEIVGDWPQSEQQTVCRWFFTQYTPMSLDVGTGVNLPSCRFEDPNALLHL